jgi:hypothetical protein
LPVTLSCLVADHHAQLLGLLGQDHGIDHATRIIIAQGLVAHPPPRLVQQAGQKQVRLTAGALHILHFRATDLAIRGSGQDRVFHCPRLAHVHHDGHHQKGQHADDAQQGQHQLLALAKHVHRIRHGELAFRWLAPRRWSKA